jgi:glycosyltransferase involved in cell wall biosynthesis
MSGAVIHVVQHLSPGGLEVMALELARAQQALGQPAFVLSLEGDAESAIAHWPRLAAQREQLLFAGKRPGLDPVLLPRLVALFRRLRPAVVHTHHVGPMLYAGAAARLARVPARLHTEHDAWHLADPRRRSLVRLARRLMAPVMIADAPHVAASVAEALGGARPVVVMNGVDTDRLRPGDAVAARRALGLPEGVRLLGIAARLEHVKGVDLALEALRLLPGDVHLAVAGGGGEAAALRAQAIALGLTQRLHWLGVMDDMARFYPALDLLLVPSRHEGLPLAPLEAQACGIRVVATRVGGTAAGICPLTGHLVPAEDPAAMARAILTALAGTGDPRPFVLRQASLDAAARACLALGARGPRPPIAGCEAARES